VNVKKNVLLYPVAIHSSCLIVARRPSHVVRFCQRPTTRRPTTAFFISCPPARPLVSESRGKACSWLFLPSCSAFHRRSSTLILDNASTRKPCARVESTSPEHGQFCRPIRAALNRARDSPHCVHPQPAPECRILHRQHLSRPAHLPCALASCGCC